MIDMNSLLTARCGAYRYYFWIPAFVPFLGCLFGGVLYDVFIYTGPSPINDPWFGLGNWMRPKAAVEERVRQQKEEGLV